MLVKVVFYFPTNMKLNFCKKSTDDLFLKNRLKYYISDIIEKDDIHPRKHSIIILELHSTKSSNDFLYFLEAFLSVFIYCFPMKQNKTKQKKKKKKTGDLIYKI